MSEKEDERFEAKYTRIDDNIFFTSVTMHAHFTVALLFYIKACLLFSIDTDFIDTIVIIESYNKIVDFYTNIHVRR